MSLALWLHSVDTRMTGAIGRRQCWLTVISFLGGCVLSSANAAGCDCLKKPFKVTPYVAVVAQQPIPVKFEHEAGGIPVKVDIQIRENDTSPFVFPGVGSAQRDDDTDKPYGGVVYKYNADEAHLFVPSKNDNFSSGTILYTGGDVWVGPENIHSNHGQVRIRVWREEDFPCPSYDSSWFKMESGKGAASFKEFEHNTGYVPSYVSVQVKNINDGWVTDGIGTVMNEEGGRPDSNWGGVLFAYNETVVRVWAPPGNSGTMFSNMDGWSTGTGEAWTVAEVRVRVWADMTASYVYDYKEPIGEHAVQDKKLFPNMVQINLDDDFVALEVEAIDGPNKGFYFSATGAVQNDAEYQSFGGLVYSYKEDTLRIWHPPVPGYDGNGQYNVAGYIIYISSLWDTGTHYQNSTFGRFHYTSYLHYDTCPPRTSAPTTLTTKSATFTSQKVTTPTTTTTPVKTTTPVTRATSKPTTSVTSQTTTKTTSKPTTSVTSQTTTKIISKPTTSVTSQITTKTTSKLITPSIANTTHTSTQRESTKTTVSQMSQSKSWTTTNARHSSAKPVGQLIGGKSSTTKPCNKQSCFNSTMQGKDRNKTPEAEQSFQLSVPIIAGIAAGGLLLLLLLVLLIYLMCRKNEVEDENKINPVFEKPQPGYQETLDF